MPTVKIPSQVQAAYLQGFWRLDEASGNATDYSANAYTLTDNGGIGARDGFRQARARSSDGLKSLDRGYASAANLNFGNNANKSFTLWGRIRADAAYSTYHFLCDFVGGTGYNFLVNSGKLTYTMAAGGYVNGNLTLEQGKIYDVCLTYDHGTTTAKLFVNGLADKVVTGQAAPGAVSSGSFKLFNYPTNGSGYGFIGEMECFAAWNIALTEAEVASLSSFSDIVCHNTGGEEHLRSGASTNVKLAQGFTVNTSGWYDMAFFKGYRNNSPTGNVYCTIESSSGGVPSGTALATSENLDVSLPFTSVGELAFRFTSPVYLTAGFYWAVLQGTYSVSATVGIRVTRSSGGAGLYNGGGAYTYNGTSWSAISTDDFYIRLNRICGNLIVSHFLEAGTSDNAEFYSNGNLEAFGQNIKFTSEKRVKCVFIWLTIFASPSGTVTAKICANNAGVPGTVLATSNSYNRNIGPTTSGPTTRANGALWSFIFTSPYTLAANTEYFLVIEASAGGSGSNYNGIFTTSGNGYPSTYDLQKRVSGSWSSYTANYDLQFALLEDIRSGSDKFFLVL